MLWLYDDLLSNSACCCNSLHTTHLEMTWLQDKLCLSFSLWSRSSRVASAASPNSFQNSLPGDPTISQVCLHVRNRLKSDALLICSILFLCPHKYCTACVNSSYCMVLVCDSNFYQWHDTFTHVIKVMPFIPLMLLMTSQ